MSEERPDRMTEPERPVPDEPIQDPPDGPEGTEPLPAGESDGSPIAGESETAAPADQAETDVIDMPAADADADAELDESALAEDESALAEDESDLAEDESDLAEEATPAAGLPVAGGTAAAAVRARRGPYQSESAPTPSEVAVRLRDRPSEIFVIVVAIVFAAILLNGVFLGKGGILTPIPSSRPLPSESAQPSSSVGPSASAVAPSSAASAAPSVSGSSQAPSAGPSQPPSAAPSPSP
jgi:hypothetical protein